jgi:hypothetical protein
MSDATIIREAVQPLTGSAQDYDSLLALIGDARFVLLGEASHGMHEFYAERAAITKRLIAERGFTVVAIEADWAGRESPAPLRARCERRCRVAGIALVGASRGSILARRWRSDQHKCWPPEPMGSEGPLPLLSCAAARWLNARWIAAAIHEPRLELPRNASSFAQASASMLIE